MKQKVLSLLSSTTEIIYALGCGDRLVGRSHECDYPEEVSDLPICTIPKFNVDGTSREVDDEVKSLVQNALSIYYINEKLLKELELAVKVAPDLAPVIYAGRANLLKLHKQTAEIRKLIDEVKLAISNREYQWAVSYTHLTLPTKA